MIGAPYGYGGLGYGAVGGYGGFGYGGLGYGGFGAGMGWGQIVQESGVHPSELAPGRLRNRNTDDTSDDGTELDTQSTSPGNSGNNGRGNGNNGRGNGNNGNNGRGNGNGRNG